MFTHFCIEHFPTDLRTFLSNFVATDVYALLLNPCQESFFLAGSLFSFPCLSQNLSSAPELELRCATPSVPGRELRRTNLASRFGGGKAEPCLGRMILISMNFRISNFACSHVDPIASLVSEQFLFSLWDVSFPCW